MFVKKFLRLQQLEPPSVSSPAVVLFLVLTIFLCFLYADFDGFSLGKRSLISEQRLLSLRRPINASLPDFLASPTCDLFAGSWVWDESYPLYRSEDCEFADEGFRCSENGRPDDSYTKWRWQPHACNLPRFNAKLMLEKLRNQRLVFVGDSLGRNQWESLLCMLSSAIVNKSSIYEVNGNPITKHKGFLIFRFSDYNCTVEYYRSPFLVYLGRPPKRSPVDVKMSLKLDVLDWTSSRWKNADILIFNTGHWWNYDKTTKGGCYFEVRKKLKMEMSLESAYRMSIQTITRWIEKEIDQTKTHVIFRTYAPVHFREGDWKSAGTCHMEKVPEIEPIFIHSEPWIKLVTVVRDVLSENQQKTSKLDVEVMNVSYMTASRKDAHPSIYYVGPEMSSSAMNRQDCSHWCLPGVPDAWNELLYALLLRRQMLARPTSQHS